MKIRMQLVTLIRCMIHYADHLTGLKEAPKTVTRITYQEKTAEIDLTEEEKGIDERRAADELENLGSIGFKNATQATLKFADAMAAVEKNSKELCTKLYTGENAKYLVGADKIPEYLSHFLEHMKRQVDEFRINSVRELRTSAEKLLLICQEIPASVASYLDSRFT